MGNNRVDETQVFSLKIFSLVLAYSFYFSDICTLLKNLGSDHNNTQQVMSRICDLTGKKAMVGNNVSHSNTKTKRKFYPNLQLQRFYIPEEGRWITLKVSTSAIKTINKIGITEAITRFVKKGTL